MNPIFTQLGANGSMLDLAGIVSCSYLSNRYEQCYLQLVSYHSLPAKFLHGVSSSFYLSLFFFNDSGNSIYLSFKSFLS